MNLIKKNYPKGITDHSGFDTVNIKTWNKVYKLLENSTNVIRDLGSIIAKVEGGKEIKGITLEQLKELQTKLNIDLNNIDEGKVTGIYMPSSGKLGDIKISNGYAKYLIQQGVVFKLMKAYNIVNAFAENIVGNVDPTLS
jgi:hypothetical protein